MISTRLMQLLRLSRNLGARTLGMTVLALASVFLAPLFDALIPEGLQDRLGPEAVLPVLTILASSMLAVTTFSLGVMVQAFQAASGQATPRAYRILMQDTTTQTVLSTFVGAFLFSLTAIVMFRADLYGPATSVVIFALTVVVIAAIILAILRWISHLAQLGSMDHLLLLLEGAARPPLKDLAKHPALGGTPRRLGGEPPSGSHAVKAPCSGYVQFIDMPGLSQGLEGAQARLWIAAHPGAYLLEGDTLAHLDDGDDDLRARIARQFILGPTRTLEQDARFGLVVLAEIAARALSPGINDPGTAIDVTHRLLHLLAGCHCPEAKAPEHPRVIAPEVSADDLLEDAYDVMIRDGAGRVEVLTQILSALRRLSASDWPEMAQAARDKMDYALDQAQQAGTLERDTHRLKAMAAPR